MYYSEKILEEVRAGNDIVDIISGYVRLQKKGSRYWGLCPFHNEKSPSFSVNGDMQVYHCFGCGAGGNVYTFVMNYENYTFPEAVRMLAERAGVALPQEDGSEEARRRGVSVTMLTDTSHVLREDYAAVVTVEKGRDSVDFKLVTLCGAGDVVVTQDYGVAAMALGRGARCLNQNGLLYTNGNIEQLLYTRHENGKARRRGHYTPVPKRTPADDEAFRRALSAMLDEGKKNE